MLEYGVKPNNSEMIILYGNPDPMAAFRAALIWKSMGVKDVRVLNGGIRAWLSKGLPIEASSSISRVRKRGSSSSKEIETKRKQKPITQDDHEMSVLIRQYIDQSMYSQNPINYLVDQNYVLDLVKNYDLFADQYALVDVRSYDEHVGRVSGYEGLSSRGRIPTSLWGRGGSSADQLEDYRLENITQQYKFIKYEIRENWNTFNFQFLLDKRNY